MPGCPVELIINPNNPKRLAGKLKVETPETIRCVLLFSCSISPILVLDHLIETVPFIRTLQTLSQIDLRFETEDVPGFVDPESRVAGVKF